MKNKETPLNSHCLAEFKLKCLDKKIISIYEVASFFDFRRPLFIYRMSLLGGFI